jgi:membrane protease YdiL (CAAX protease family)
MPAQPDHGKSVLAVTAVMARIEGRPLTSYGLGGTRRLRLCGSGMLWGFATLSLLIACLRLAGVLVLGGPELNTMAALSYAARWLLAFFAVAIFEEAAFRGYLQYTLARGVGFWWSALLWSSLFAASHLSNHGESVLGVLQTGWIALFFCVSLWLTGSLWWAIGFHSTWDWAESYFYGTANSGLKATGHLWSAMPQGNVLLSGGSTGPEGSIFSFVVLVVPLAALWLIYGRQERQD